MLGLLNISEASNIAIHSLAFLASSDSKTNLSVTTISSRLEISSNHLHKVLQKLVKAKIIRSSRGISGGYSLIKSSKDISLLAIIKIVDGPFDSSTCLLNKPMCKNTGSCKLKQLSSHVENFLKKTKLSEFKAQNK